MEMLIKWVGVAGEGERHYLWLIIGLIKCKVGYNIIEASLEAIVDKPWKDNGLGC